MEMPPEIWIAACAHELQRRWRTIDPDQLAETATDLWRDKTLRDLPPAQAAVAWLRPVINLNAASADRRADVARTP